MDIKDILIIGGGPSGLTAAIYGRRQGKSCLLIEKEGLGGQIAQAPLVENYPGVPAQAGAELAMKIVDQVMDLDTEIEIANIVQASFKDGIFTLQGEDGEIFYGRSIILAAGTHHRTLQQENTDQLLGNGLSYCAVCDGSFYAGQEVAVVGGGNSALQEALLLSDIASQVHLIHRRNTFSGDVDKLLRIRTKANIQLHTPYEIQQLRSKDGKLSCLQLRNTESAETVELPVAALFVCIGTLPNLGAFTDFIELDKKGYALIGENCTSNTPGFFVAGDCRSKAVRQLTTAVGDGANAALAACEYLDSLT